MLGALFYLFIVVWVLGLVLVLDHRLRHHVNDILDRGVHRILKRRGRRGGGSKGRTPLLNTEKVFFINSFCLHQILGANRSQQINFVCTSVLITYLIY